MKYLAAPLGRFGGGWAELAERRYGQRCARSLTGQKHSCVPTARVITPRGRAAAAAEWRRPWRDLHSSQRAVAKVVIEQLVDAAYDNHVRIQVDQLLELFLPFPHPQLRPARGEVLACVAWRRALAGRQREWADVAALDAFGGERGANVGGNAAAEHRDQRVPALCRDERARQRLNTFGVRLVREERDPRASPRLPGARGAGCVEHARERVVDHAARHLARHLRVLRRQGHGHFRANPKLPRGAPRPRAARDARPGPAPRGRGARCEREQGRVCAGAMASRKGGMESVKNKQPAPMQITAEQILREARERQEDDAFQAPAQKVRAHARALSGGRQGGGSRTRGRQGVDRQPAHLSAGAARPRAIGAAQL